MSRPVSTQVGSVAVLLATGLGIGKIRYAPGTFGSLWALPITWSLWHLPLAGQLIAISLLCVGGVPICTLAARHLGLKDPGCVVWDEFAAMPIVYLGLSSQEVRQPLLVLIGFGLFRIFDISKLPPCKQLERFPDGWGIMLDDIAAAAYAWLSFWLIRSFFSMQGL